MIAESIQKCAFRLDEMLIFMAPRWKMMAQTCPQEGQEREYKRRISEEKSQKSLQNQGFYGVFCKSHFNMIMISTLLFMTDLPSS